MISKFAPPIATSKFARRVVATPVEPSEETTDTPAEKLKRHRRTRAEMAALRGETPVASAPRTKYAAMEVLTESKEAAALLKTAERLESEAAKARAKAKRVGAEAAYKAATLAVTKLKKDLAQAESALARATDRRNKAVELAQ